MFIPLSLPPLFETDFTSGYAHTVTILFLDITLCIVIKVFEHVWANNVDPYHKQQSDHSLHCVLFFLYLLDALHILRQLQHFILASSVFRFFQYYDLFTGHIII